MRFILSEARRITITDKTDEYVKLLKRFKQVIFQGPPGTGKTYSAKCVAAEITKESGRREIIQFHPSYNYEDFVRGIQVKTEGGQTSYETVDRILLQMARKASDAPEDNNHVLIIDEINRANVSAVLGELIYALEYRGEKVGSPYEKDGNTEIVLPHNLYIIGTMNTADRTIGQIDYAVRRRFAFVTLLPQTEVVAKSQADKSVEVFDMVAKLFIQDNGYISPDYDANDVAIGHSYFLAEDNDELAHKVKYQVIPILEEYIKDGVLLKEAEKIVREIEEQLELETHKPGKTQKTDRKSIKKFRWEHTKNGTESSEKLGCGHLVRTIVKDYVKNNRPQNIDELKKTFPDSLRPSFGVVQLRDDIKRPKRYFPEEYDITLNGQKVTVTNQWGANPPKSSGNPTYDPDFQQFLNTAETIGYKIEEI